MKARTAAVLLALGQLSARALRPVRWLFLPPPAVKPRDRILRRLLRNLAIIGVLDAVLLFAVGGSWAIVFAGLVIGFPLGALVGFFDGYGDARANIRHVYGEEWDVDAVLGRAIRDEVEKVQKAPMN